MSTRTTLLTLLAGISIAATAACTTTISQFEDDGGGAGGSGNGTGAGAGTGGGQTQCEGFEDTTQTTDVAVTIRNDTDAPIFLGSLDCEVDIDLRLYDADDQRVSYRPGACHFTCAELQQTDAVCAAGCAAPLILMIAPGGTHRMAWDGTVHEPTEMPAACYFGPEFAGPSCDVRIGAPAGGYAFEVIGYDDSWCPLDQPGACECTPDANGTCMVEQYGDLLAGSGVPARASLEFPNNSSVEIVFE